MNKAEIVDQIAHQTGFTKVDSKQALDTIIDIITKTVANNQQVQLTGFGKFEPVPRKATTAINPQTQEKINVPSKVIPKFRPGKNFKQSVNNSLQAVESGSGDLNVKLK